MGATLNSDHVNYLIWRYLQERGYGRSAVQLMRDWNLEPEKLPFAPTVKPHTLVSILQDGLTYDELASASAARDPGAQRSERQPDVNEDSRRYSFLEKRKRRASDSADESRMDSGRKRPRWQTNGLNPVSTDSVPQVAPNRPRRRKSSVVAPQINGEPMNLDDSEPQVEDPKPQSPEEDVEMQVEEPEPPIISTLMVGQSIGIQIDIRPKPLATTVDEMVIPGSNVYYLNWSSSVPPKLIATGDTLWRSWTIPKTQDTNEEKKAHIYTDHATDENVSCVTAISPAPTGEYLTMAVHTEFTNSVLLQAQPKPVPLPDFSNEPAEPLPEQPFSVISRTAGVILVLRWNPPSSHILSVIINDNQTTQFRLYDVPGATPLGLLQAVRHPAYDATWISEDKFVVCGEKYISLYSALPALQHLQTIQTTESWDYVRWDKATNLIACVFQAEGRIALIEITSPTSPNDATSETAPEPPLPPQPAPTHDHQITIKHTALQPHNITAIEWQPLPPTSLPLPPTTPTRLLAVSSIDGNVSIWNALHEQGLQCLHSFFMGNSPRGSLLLTIPALALAFSPDGVYVAGVGEGRLCVWRTESEGGKTLCVWEEEMEEDADGKFDESAWGPLEKVVVNGNGDGHAGPGQPTAALPELGADVAREQRPVVHALAWYPTAARLAFGRGQKVTVIDLDLPAE